MGLHKDYDEGQTLSELNYEDKVDNLEELDESEHKKRVRRMLEERLERKRLKQELEDELDGEFDWDEFDKE